MATPKPAFFGCERFGLTAPVDVRLTPSFSSPVIGSNTGATLVIGSAGLASVQRRVAAGDRRHVRRVEHVGAQLDVPALRQPDVARDRQVERLLEAPVEVAVAGLEADAADGRSLERRRVELAVEDPAVAARARDRR